MKIKKEGKGEKPDPDEKSLKEEFEAETKDLEESAAAEKEQSRRKQANIEPLIKASGFSMEDINRKVNQAKSDSRASLQKDEPQLLKPLFDIEARHAQDQALAKRVSEQLSEKGNPYWNGYIWHPSYAWRWMSWNGEAEEVPNVTFNTSNNRFDPRAQAWGEGLWDADWSLIHGYLAFTFSPPSWGRLYVYVSPWLHGYYHLFSNDEWWNREYARAELDTWVDLYQNFRRNRQYRRRLTIGGAELHPVRYGRIDRGCSHSYYTNVGQGDLVTIRVGVRLYCYARAGGSHSILNFQSGAANYVKVPYIYWYLRR